jgi:ubiquinone/menaquinone biosynthesis C-methylase UbiE
MYTIESLYTKRNSLYHFIFFTLLGYDRRVEDFLYASIRLHEGMRILDAGCGSGLCTKKLIQLAADRGLSDLTFNAFDLTEAMLVTFRQWVEAKRASNVTIKQADFMALDQLPKSWRGYNFIIAAASLEYLQKDKLGKALKDLRIRLAKDGEIILIITQQNLVTRMLVNWLWKASTYRKAELETIFRQANFRYIQFLSFPGKRRLMNRGMFIVKLR